MSGAGAAGWAMTLLGARQSPQEGAGILQVSRTPPLRQGIHVLAHSREKWRVQRGRPERSRLSHSAPQKGLRTCSAVVSPPTAGLQDQLGQGHLATVTFLVAFPMASPHET